VELECTKGFPIKINIDESVPPKAQPHRRIPFHVRKQVEDKIRELEKADIIERAEGPTPWVSPIVVTPKPNGIRICVDMREANKAISRERHIIPTIDDIMADLNGCTVFSKIDLNQGYHQLLLHPDSRYITTFSTHVGLWRYKRLNFGLTCAAEIFQKKVSDVLHGIPGVRNISDDIYVGGRGTEEHDVRLRQVLERLQINQLTINKEKCAFRVPKMTFFGNVFSKYGISPDPNKVKAIKDAAAPANASEVRSLLSSVAFCSRFIANFATITYPLRRLTHKDVLWQWGEAEQNALEKLKEAISDDTVLGYFDPQKTTCLYVDASPFGLGAVLTQDKTVLYYASRALTDTERRYSQIEREALAIRWAIRRFHLYLYGSKFRVVTDHKPLLPLFNNTSSKPPARIEKWIIELQGYDFELEYQPGKENPADFPSRHPIQKASEKEESEAEEYIAYIAANAAPKAISIEEVSQETEADPTLQAVRQALKTGQWHKSYGKVSVSELARYEKIKCELTDTGTVLLKGHKLVIPCSLQERVIDIAHSHHQGIVKTKAMLREKVWFPMLDLMVEKKIASCLTCQVSTPSSNREPLKMTTLPDGPFQDISIDFASVDRETLLIVVDDYSRFPLVQPVTTTSAEATIPKLHEMFSMFGVPNTVKSDNGPPFNGAEFKKFAETQGFHHRKVTPYWPRANGEVERFVRTLKKNIHASKTEGKNWRKELQSFLGDYRDTPHTTTGKTPSEMFLKRKVKTKIPSFVIPDPDREKIATRDKAMKAKQKMYHDAKSYVKPSTLEEGDVVVVKNTFDSRSKLPYHPEPLEITRKKGSMITARNDDRQVTRNSSHFKRLSDGEVSQPVEDITPDIEPPEPLIYQRSPLKSILKTPENETSVNGTPEHTTPMDSTPEKVLDKVVEPRRSTRVRFQPSHLKDYVTK